MDTGCVLGHQCFWEPTGVTQQPGDLAGWWAQDLAHRPSPVLEARSWTPAGRCPPCVALNQLGPHRVPRTGLGQGQAHRLHPLQQPHTASPLSPPPAGAAIAAQEDGRPLWPLERPPVPVSAQQGGCPPCPPRWGSRAVGHSGRGTVGLTATRLSGQGGNRRHLPPPPLQQLCPTQWEKHLQ